MSFKNISLKQVYFSDSGDDSNIIDDFYLPALSSATEYMRAVGFFSPDILRYALQGIVEFARNDGKLCLIVGEALDDELYNQIQASFDSANRKLTDDIINDKLELLISESPKEFLPIQLLIYLIEKGNAEIKFAFRRQGMYHDKIGYMKDKYGNEIVFHGSLNETVYGYHKDFNDESISVYSSLSNDDFSIEGRGTIYRERVVSLCTKSNFNDTLVIDIPSDGYKKIVSVKSEEFSIDKCPNSLYQKDLFDLLQQEKLIDEDETRYKNSLTPFIPNFLFGNKYSLKQHQIDALNSWAYNEFKGIFALATGAGKTITAIHTAVKLVDNNRFALVISVPYQVLADQWVENLALFNIRPIRCYQSSTQWVTELDGKVNQFRLGLIDFFAVVVVNRTLSSQKFQKTLKKLDSENLFFVGDECHRHSSSNWQDLIPESKFKIGLSATPWSVSDSDKKHNLINIYGKVVAKYSIDKALKDGVLEKYDYIPHFVYMNAEEEDKYIALSAEIASLLNKTEALSKERLEKKIRARNRLIGSIESKFTKFEEVVSPEIRNNVLVYCGDGSTELSPETSKRDIEQLSQILYDNGWVVSKFTADETKVDRQEILRQFKNSHINAVIAIRVLDEGFDLPSCREAHLLASSRNERQFIQRRGRVLRKHKDKSKAKIHDYVVLPMRRDSVSLKNLVYMELCRAFEFSRVSHNKKLVESELIPFVEEYSFDLDEVSSFYFNEYESCIDV